MKNNKLLETILIFDPLERKRFRNVIKNKRRSSLLALYELCLSRLDKELPLPEKEEVYTYLFEEAYSKENDFLLRNEYRLLTDEAEAFLRTHAVQSQFPGLSEAARLRRIYESGNATLFKKEFDALSQKFGDDLWFWLVSDPVYVQYYIMSDAFTYPHFAEVKKRIDEARDRLNRLYNRLLTDYEVRKAHADKVYSALSDTAIVPVESATVPATADELVRYRQLKALMYYQNGEEKIATLLRANEILKNTKLPELGHEEMWWLQAAIGLEYFLQYNFKEAVLYLDALFAMPGIESFNRLPEAGLNYLSALMSCGDYEKAVRIIAPFEERVEASPVVFYKYICLKALSLAFLGRAAAARKELNRIEEHLADFNFLYWRVAMILSFGVEKRWEDAQNEFRNMLKTKNLRQNSRPDLENLIYVMDRLIKLGAAREQGKKISVTVWQQCDKKVREMIDNPGDFLHPPRLIDKLLQELKPVEEK